MDYLKWLSFFAPFTADISQIRSANLLRLNELQFDVKFDRPPESDDLIVLICKEKNIVICALAKCNRNESHVELSCTQSKIEKLFSGGPGSSGAGECFVLMLPEERSVTRRSHFKYFHAEQKLSRINIIRPLWTALPSHLKLNIAARSMLFLSIGVIAVLSFWLAFNLWSSGGIENKLDGDHSPSLLQKIFYSPLPGAGT